MLEIPRGNRFSRINSTCCWLCLSLSLCSQVDLMCPFKKHAPSRKLIFSFQFPLQLIKEYLESEVGSNEAVPVGKIVFCQTSKNLGRQISRLTKKELALAPGHLAQLFQVLRCQRMTEKIPATPERRNACFSFV